ncbi:hypothetical protein BG011_005769 [Mortierella polycephala]|uniref:UBX domain-containing protein n=1 Tax=Mortierella polycephala TaxID=41804 RepID=A0A9P6U0J3_9FUNG|nr:hypothetical protein BG011_005769 [Mortierella polycephala]
MNSDLRASLLDLGFTLSQARAAVAAGNTTVDAATEWIFENLAAANTSGSNSTLHLRNEQGDGFDADLQKALAESTKPQATPLPSAAVEAADNGGSAAPSKKIAIHIIRNPTPPPVIPLLPLTSRHKTEEQDALNATRVAEAVKRADKAKKDRAEARLAKQRALNDLKEDRENRKVRAHGAVAASSSASSVVPQQQQQAPAPTTPGASHTMVQIRLKNGIVLKRSLESSATIKDLFDFARSEDGNVGSADISLIQPFPRREYTLVDGDLTLSEAGLCPSCSLNVFVQTPIPAPQPINPGGARLSADTDTDMEEPPTENNQDETMSGHDDDQGDDDQEDEDEEMMHALPIHVNPPQNPFIGQGRGRGRGGLPFSGTGHSLGSSSGGSASAANEQEEQEETPESTPEESDALRRHRVLEAMANRPKRVSDNDLGEYQGPSKKVKERTVPTLQSLCCYEVAVLLTAKDAKSSKHLKLLGENVGSQVGESIVQKLIELKQLDQLTFKRLYRCPLVNIVLDAYSRATDSLMDAIGASQARSLACLSLKECMFLTDRGFRNISRFEELEYLDLSHCRITDKTLEYTLNLPNLTTLNLSATKVTSNGLAKVIAEAAWKSTLQTLDVSYCQGIAGSSVLVNLQELTNIRTLKLNSTLAFNLSPVRVPSSQAFTQLLDLNLSRTPITACDFTMILNNFKSVENLNLTSCDYIDTAALEQCVQGLPQLHNISFPNREHDLLTILPAASALPLTHLDLTGFLFVTDQAILALSAATNLQMLSLSGTKLTDTGSTVFAHMSSLKELSLDRTDIGDKTIDYLRDLGRIEVLSLHRCSRLTTAGVIQLGKCAFFSLKLKRLNLSNNKFIHDEALACFTQCKELNSLNLEYTDVTDQGALRLQNMLPSLTQLRIQGITNGDVYKVNPRPTFV